ncbi:MAG: hypothetical protein NVSMB10_18240 [Steroidobacteraceae bacterium]
MIVTQLRPAGPGALAGLKVGDLLTHVGNKQLSTVADIAGVAKPTSAAPLLVRDGSASFVAITGEPELPFPLKGACRAPSPAKFDYAGRMRQRRFGGWRGRRASALLVAAVFLSAAATAQVANTDARVDELRREVEELKAVVRELQQQVATMNGAAAAGPTARAPAPAAPAAPGTPAAPPSSVSSASSAATLPAAAATADLWEGTSINALLDGYYEYNFNSPVGRTNTLRAYDVSSNSFSLAQADLVFERAADVAHGRRAGVRLDLQFGQATSTLQGNPANELRPEVYRNIFQAYGTYVFPVAAGLTVDFGKWASSLGIEGNYTKDQLNHSRSFWFDYLPFYHMGVRSKLALNDQLAFNVWIANGTNQTEAFNNYKDQLVGVVITPTPALSWTLNLYQGQEHPDVVYITNPSPGQLGLPNQQGSYIQPIGNAPNGKLKIADSYLAWQATKALTVAAEADYVEQRLYSYSRAQHVDGGALYVGYQFSDKISAAARGEYLADIGGLYSGATQYLKEVTLSLDYRPADGFLMRGEYRRDQSNQPYFLGHSLGDLQNRQPTIGLDLVWWFGQKTGTW